MEERKNAEQAYKDALTKMSMPAIFDADKEMFSNGRSGIKMKSKVLAYAAAAAVLAVSVGAGAIMLRSNDSEDFGSASSMTEAIQFEADQTIPDGEITSAEQAVQEYRKCILLENDEYLKLKQNKDNITPDVAKSFKSRTRSIYHRYEKCEAYFNSSKDEQLPEVLAAVKYGDGYINFTYRLSQPDDPILSEKNNWYLCDAKTGKKVVECTVEKYVKFEFSAKRSYNGLSFKIPTEDIGKLTGDLSLVVEKNYDSSQKRTVIKDFRFMEKTLLGTDERNDLEGEAYMIAKIDYSITTENSENSIKLNADKIVCSQHGMYVRISLTAANDTGKYILKKDFESEHTDVEVLLGGKDPSCAPQTDVNFVKPVFDYWHTTVVSSTESKLVYDCFLPMNREIDMDFGITINAMVMDPKLSNDEIANGEWRGLTLGSIKVKYEKPMKERTFICGDKKIQLSDLCMTFSDTKANVTDVTLKMDDGSSLTLKKEDFSENSISMYDEDPKDTEGRLNESFNASPSPDDVNACFITKSVDTSHVTSIVYAGQEYKLFKTPWNDLLKKTKASDISKMSIIELNGKRDDLTGKDIGEFLALLRAAKYTSVSRDAAYAPVDRGYPETVKIEFKDGSEQELILLGGYGDGSGKVLYKGFIHVDDKDYECNIQPFLDFFSKHQNK